MNKLHRLSIADGILTGVCTTQVVVAGVVIITGAFFTFQSCLVLFGNEKAQYKDKTTDIGQYSLHLAIPPRGASEPLYYVLMSHPLTLLTGSNTCRATCDRQYCPLWHKSPFQPGNALTLVLSNDLPNVVEPPSTKSDQSIGVAAMNVLILLSGENRL